MHSCISTKSVDLKTEEASKIAVLVFSKTEGWRHASIDQGKQTMISLSKQHNFKLDTTEDASLFNSEALSDYHVVVWLNTTGNVLNEQQQIAFEQFVKQGGGFVGIHAAADTEYDWPWYGDLVGAYFKNHPNDPNVREADVIKAKLEHDCTKHLPETWTKMDEWYNYKEVKNHLNHILMLDETSYQGGEMDNNHPIAWYHETKGGRAFYTGMGHTAESFREPLFTEMIAKAVKWAANIN